MINIILIVVLCYWLAVLCCCLIARFVLGWQFGDGSEFDFWMTTLVAPISLPIEVMVGIIEPIRNRLWPRPVTHIEAPRWDEELAPHLIRLARGYAELVSFEFDSEAHPDTVVLAVQLALPEVEEMLAEYVPVDLRGRVRIATDAGSAKRQPNTA